MRIRHVAGFSRRWGSAPRVMMGAERRTDAKPQAAGGARPNFIIIFTDDQGYQDVGCFGSPKIKTPRLDRMAREGMKFTSFYAQTVCGPLRAALMTGCYPLRVPCIMRAPGRIPAGTTCDEIACTMDMLPTLAVLAGAAVPKDRIIDGHDIRHMMHGKKGAASRKEAFYYYQHTHLQAVRSGKWKLHLPRPAQPPWTPRWARHIDPKDVFEVKKPMLYDLAADIGESTDVAEANPKVVARLLALAEKGRNDIGDYNRIGKGARFYDPQPRRPDAAKWR